MPVAVENTAHTTSITATARNTPLCSITWLTAKPTIAQPQPAHAITRGPSSTPNTTNTSDSNQAITNPTMPAITAITIGHATTAIARLPPPRLPLTISHIAIPSSIAASTAVIENSVAGNQPSTKLMFINHARMLTSCFHIFHFQRASCSPRNVGTTSSLRLIFLGISTKNTVSKLNE